MCSESDRNSFRFTDYDVIGFDFDNTIAEYKLTNLFHIHHSFLINYLIEHKGYDGISTELSSEYIDIIRKGLFIDIERGNILSICDNGKIIQASHGTRKLETNEIISTYGLEMHWYATDQFLNDKLITVNSDVIYSFNDFTDISALPVYTKAIDFVDQTKLYSYRTVWSHLLEAIQNMYKPDSNFIITVGSNLNDYINKCDEELMQWLVNLNRKCKLIIITSAQPETFKPVVNHCLGNIWKTLFHTIIDKANKPKFFIERNSFIDSKTNEKLLLNTSAGYYSCGNWYEFYEKFSEELGRPAKCLYIGDNVLHDIYGPSATYGGHSLDTVAIAEECLAEGIFPGQHAHGQYIRSDFWGSYFWHPNGTRTVMGDIIMRNSKLCVPSLKYFIDKPLNHQYTPFWISKPHL
ncbi:hypothetical protein O3M35_000141 [Rhynocoris fuscipes]|uniref:5'-nucleotidase domain-containing protein 1 n=1 Tax=Rhynocoris fuscipes TaxID=488301 RepID=A0AAW1DMG4_9HEMI